jgi:RNA polymerase sigma-70 factor (ECF subfamily)
MEWNRVMDLNQLADETLLTRLQAGCEESFVALYRRHRDRIYRFALAMCGDEAMADEVTQEVFLAVLDGEVRHDPARGGIGGLLLGFARNHVRRILRREGRYRGDADGDERDSRPDTLVDLTRRELIESVRRAVLSLPPAYREVVTLCEIQQTGYAAAAEVLGLPVGTVRSRLHRARTMLGERLRPRVGTLPAGGKA